MASQASLEDVRQIGERYRHDLNGYRYDVLGRKPAGKRIEEICDSVVHNKRTAVASGHGIGKALAHGEPVLTLTGWRSIETLCVGDEVIARDGSAVPIVGVFPQGERDLFRLTLDDGSSVVVDAEHRWLTVTRSERKHGKPGRVRTTAEIAGSLTFPNGPRLGLNHQLPALDAVRHPTASLPVDPYVFGVWLGDGDARGVVTGLAEQFDRLAQAGAALGSAYHDPRSRAITRSLLGVRPALRALGVFGCRAHEKRIPPSYLHADVEQRTSMLQGLLDTDGSANGKGAITFEVVSAELADGVAELARSLGGVVRRTTKPGSYGGIACRLVHRLFLSLPSTVTPFRDPAKLARYVPRWGTKNCDRTRCRHIAAVEPAGRGLATCIAVDHPEHLFVTRDHIVTHNTGLSADAIHWFLSTRANPAIVATANTAEQLEGKLWRELNLTNQKAANQGWFDWKKTTFTRFNDVTAQAVALTWNEQNSEAFAGTHAEDVLGIFDEASAIPKVIFTVFSGAMTTPGARWLAVGNSTRAEGYFYDCTHGKLRVLRADDALRGHWHSFVVPSWESPFVTEEWVSEWERNEGCDRNADPNTWTDDFRTRVAGLPPKTSADTFFIRSIVDAAMKRELDMFDRWPLILGCDVGRGDRSVMLPRRGRIVMPKVEIIQGMRTMDFARRIAEELKFYREEHGLTAQAILEELGMGVGVVEALQDMDFADQVWGINTGESSSDPKLYLNLRCEMYALAKEWMEDVVMLPNLPPLTDDLMKIRRKPTANGQLKLESKDEMRRRGEKSPDVGDAFALTFAVPFDLLRKREDDWDKVWREQGGGSGGTWMGN